MAVANKNARIWSLIAREHEYRHGAWPGPDEATKSFPNELLGPPMMAHPVRPAPSEPDGGRAA